MTTTVQEFKQAFVISVVEYLDAFLKTGKSVSWQESVADGYAKYYFEDDFLYVGGAYGSFAGDDVYGESPKIARKVDKEIDWDFYQLEFSMADVRKHMTYDMAASIMKCLS